MFTSLVVASVALLKDQVTSRHIRHIINIFASAFALKFWGKWGIEQCNTAHGNSVTSIVNSI